jgi:putative aldouronate transport system permease protein
MNKLKKRYNTRETLELSALCLPAAALVFLFCYVPMVGVIVAFKDFRYDLGVFGSRWVGFENFLFFFTSNDAVRITGNTLIMNAMFIAAGTLMAIIFALLMYELTKKWMVKLYQTLHLLPHFISWVIVGYMTYAFFNPQFGIANQVLKAFGLSSVEWYAVPAVWPAILVIFYIWKSVGMGLIIYYAALMGIDSRLFEAATLDGANRFKQIIYISLPSLYPLIIIQVILSIGNIFRADFGMFYQLTRDVGALYSTTDVIDTYVYRALKSMGNMSMSAAVGLFQSVVGFVLVIVTNWTVNKINPENSLF